MPAVPTISGHPSPAADATADKKKKKHHGPREPVREALETVVFVVVLVLLLKLFAVEAFVIPTGSMAETLYGFHKWVECPECGVRAPVNCSDESDPQGGAEPTPVKEYTCPNCLHFVRNTGTGKPAIPTDDWNGDRVLVLKAIYHLEDPKRGQVVVFKYPEAPQKSHQAQNYIKRLWATGGETLALHRTKVFIAKPGSVDYSGYDGPADPLKAWQREYRFHNASEAVAAFNTAKAAGFPAGGTFELFRKSDDMVLEMRRPVYDNDHQAKSLVEAGAPPRWAERDGTTWTPDKPAEPKVFTHAGDALTWVRYKHLVGNLWANPPKAVEDRITNFMGYNTSNMAVGKRKDPGDYWTGDLMLECKADLGAGSEVALELSRGPHRYQARFGGGKVTLVRVTGTKEEEITSAPCAVTAPGEYALRFANVDCRLRVWVKKVGLFGVWKKVDFGDKADYPFAPIEDFDSADRFREGLTKANDLDAPASIGAKGAVTVKNLMLYRDTVYTHLSEARPDAVADTVDTFYIQPGHYMCLGDNSAQSSDGRDWGTVPERLLLGRAVFVFWPALPVNRIGLIK